MRGAYGRIKDEENSRGVVQYLRDKSAYAVLLGCFANARPRQDVSLAHVFYWRDDELRKIYIVAPRPLAIAEDLRITTTPDELRKGLKASGAEVLDEFSRYSRHVIKLFHLRSEKALDIELLAKATAAAQSQLEEQGGRAQALKASVDGLRRQQIDLNVAISTNTAGQQLQQLRREIDHTRERRREKKLRADKYSGVARALTLPPPSDDAAFFATAKRAREALAPIEKRMQALVHERDARKQEEGRLRGLCQTIQTDPASLRGRKSRIPAEDLRMRAQLAQTLAIADDELPFVGELLKVRDEARAWEGAIERLLRNYGRQMIVPDAHYRRVIGYVEATNLRGKLVFHRADGRRTSRATGHDPDALFGKLEIKPDAVLHDWLSLCAAPRCRPARSVSASADSGQ